MKATIVIVAYFQTDAQVDCPNPSVLLEGHFKTNVVVDKCDVGACPTMIRCFGSNGMLTLLFLLHRKDVGRFMRSGNPSAR